jgi:predicted GNAT family acetyltransferase
MAHSEVSMFIHIYYDAEEFLTHVQPVLLTEEVKNSLILGIAHRLRKLPIDQQAQYLATVEDEQGLLLAALMTPPFNLALAAQDEKPDAAMLTFIRYVRAHQWPVPGVRASVPLVDHFAHLWAEQTGKQAQLTMGQRTFELTQVISPHPVPGRFRVAVEADYDVLTRWTTAFMAEAVNDTHSEDIPEATLSRIRAGDLFVWESEAGEIVSMAEKTRPVVNVITIALVYTPPELRGKGYAANCVAALSQHLLNSGWSICSLTTDLANPISNRIYQRMGYRPTCDFNEYSFEP